MLVPALAGLLVEEYAPNQVKKSVIGVGHGDKHQIAMMVKVLMPRAEFNSEHAWILNYLVTAPPSGSKGVQTSVLAILAGGVSCEDDLESAIINKLKISLGEDLFS